MGALPRNRLHLLLYVPVATYAVSYGYLALYHGEWWLWNTIVHEGGSHTLLWTTLYTSHFLGHIPSLTVIALIFTGCSLSMISMRSKPGNRWKLLAGISGLLILTVLISGFHFGWSETGEFILQQRQSVARLESGGSWLLHLPSTILMFVFVPLFLAAAARAFGYRVESRRQGRSLLVAGGLLIIVLTV